MKWLSNLRLWQKRTLPNYFDKAWHLHFFVSSMDLILTVIIALKLRKENIEIHEATRFGGRVRLLVKEWFTQYFVHCELAVDKANIFVSLIPTECRYNHPKLVWWFERYCWGRKRNCQCPGSHRTIGVPCLQVCNGSFHGKPKRHFFRGKLWYVNLFSNNFSVRYLVDLLIVKIKERRNVCFDGRELHHTTLEAGHMTNNRSRSHKPR